MKDQVNNNHAMALYPVSTKYAVAVMFVSVTLASCRNQEAEKDASMVKNNRGLVCFAKDRFEEVFLGKPRSFVRERLGSPDEIDAVYGGSKRTGSRSEPVQWGNGVLEEQVSTYQQVYKEVWRYDNRVLYESGNLIRQVYLRFDADDRYVEKVWYKQ